MEGGNEVVGKNDIVGDKEGKVDGRIVGDWVGFSDG